MNVLNTNHGTAVSNLMLAHWELAFEFWGDTNFQCAIAANRLGTSSQE